MTPHFAWTCSYLNCAWYNVIDETGRYEIELRRGTCDYERKISNYKTEECWQREVVAAIGTIRRKDRNDKPIPASTVAAFNKWRADEHAALIARMRAQPNRYGEILDNDPSFPAPPVVKGARFDPEAKAIVLT